MIDKYQRDLSETQGALFEEGQQRSRLQMELDAKDSEIEQLRQKLLVMNVDSASVSSGNMDELEIQTGIISIDNYVFVIKIFLRINILL